MLALDVSSISIGYVYAHDGTVRAYGTIALTHPDVFQRISQAHHEICDLLATYHPRVLIVERNSGTHVNALIRCAQTVGVAILAAHLHDVAFVEISAKAGKKLLTGNGNASKADMLIAACARLQVAHMRLGTRKGSVAAFRHDGTVAIDEHAADALGLLLAYQAEQARRLLEAA